MSDKIWMTYSQKEDELIRETSMNLLKFRRTLKSLKYPITDAYISIDAKDDCIRNIANMENCVLEFEAHEAALLADIRNFLIKKRLNILQEFTKVVEDKSITQFVIKSVSLKQNNS